ncbi:MAG: 2-dehydropantoate 2-reductase [Bacteroidales bacterium]|nr:2-dehydropantoate 2-reductase [Bacteroidales bacterium]
MKYLIIGAGGTGGSIAVQMTAAGKDVTAIARGEHLKAICASGLKMESYSGESVTVPVKATDMEHYDEQPDVIFNCVKGYSLPQTIPFIQRVAHKNTVVIPVLNIYGTGGRMQQQLPDLLVTDGCIYIAATIKEPGVISRSGDIFRIVFGVRKPEEYRPVLQQIAADLQESGIRAILSDNILRDAFQKFTYISAMAACGAYYDVDAGVFQIEGKERNMFVDLTREILKVAEAIGLRFTVDILQTNLKILDNLAPTASASMQRDMRQGKESEIDGLVFEVVRMGKQYGVQLPVYEKVAKKFGFQG